MLTEAEFTPEKQASARNYIRPFVTFNAIIASYKEPNHVKTFKTINICLCYPRRKYKFTITTQLPFTKIFSPLLR